MNDPSPSPDALAAPALRRAVRAERARREAVEQENARLRAALARQNVRLGELEAANQALRERGQELADQLGAALAQVQALAGEVAALREENARLRAERGGEQPGAAAQWPPSWVKAKAAKPATKRERKRRAARRVQVIDLPAPAPVEVIEHVLLERRCPGCRKRVCPAPPGEAAGCFGQGRFGPRLVAAVAVWRTLERLPVRQLQARLAREHGLALSRGGVMRLLHLAAGRARPAYEQIRAPVQASPVVHLDETTWREGGRHGYVWVATTPDACLFHRDPSRGGRVVDALLGARTERTFVSDFYAAYDHCPEQHQRCWAHLWRDIADLQALHPRDEGLAAWIEALRAIWGAATGPRPAAEEGDGHQVLACCPDTMPPERPEAALAARLRRYSDDLFTFVRHPAVPPTNNLAERRLRPLVIGRKISGGTRSQQGGDDRMVLSSVLHTALLRGQDPYQTCSAFLTTAAPPDAS